MSKQGKRSSAKLVAWAVALCMILGVLSPTLMYAQVSVGTDIDGHWAQAQIERWIERGIVKGYEDGTFKPENPIKRCEFAALMNRTFGFMEKAKVDFSDIEGTEWFVGDIAKAVAAGYMIGDAEGTFRPDDPIARQEAALVLARIYELKDQGKKHLFKDSDEIASWSHWAVMAVVDAGLMEGYPDGTFGPKNPIKRSETVTVLDRLVAEIFTEEGVYGKEDAKMTIAGNAHVLADGVEIQNAKITGDLLIAQSVGDGTVILDNVTVDGNVKVQGGGKESIILKDSKIGSLEVVKKDVRIVIIGSTQVAKAYVKAPSTIVQEEVEGEGIAVLTIEELIGEGVVTLSGNFEEVRITGEDANVVIPEGQVENLYIEAPEVVVELGSDATIANLVVDEPAEVTGTGSITNATINASGTVIEPEPENITIPEGVTAIIAGEEVVGGEEPAAPPVAPGRLEGITGVSIDGLPLVGYTLTAKVTPEGATVTYQWQRKNGEGTFEDITGATSQAYVLTEDDLNNNIRVKAIGTGRYVGTAESEPLGPVSRVLNITQNKGYDAIQEAVTEAAERDTIVVGAGTFSEELTIDKSLTILGVNADKDPRTEGLWTDESVVTGGIRITGGDVTLKGLTIETKGILASSIASLTVINNRITDISEAMEGSPAGSIIGLDVMGLATGPIVIQQNVFSDIGQENSTGTAIRMVKAADSITISNNIIRDVTKNGINLYTNCLANENAKLTITGNEISNWDSDMDSADIGGRAIRIDFVGAHDSATAVITENKLIPPTYEETEEPVDPEYVKLTSVGIKVDLTKNYWGSESPVFEKILLVEGDKASDCAYVPYYTDEAMTILGPPVINSTQGTGYDTIQAAITEADEGDTIVITAGTYNEEVTITDTSLTIQGTEGTVLTGGIFAKATTSGKSLTVSNITFNTRNLEVNGYDTVNITNNTFEDITTFRKVEGVIAADAIYVYGSNTGTVTIKGNTINGVRDDINHPGDGIGITIHDYDNITIDDNTISDTYHNCVNLYRGIAGEVKITNNTFSNWDSNQDYQKEDGKYYYKKNGEETEVSAGCEGGRALRLALDSTATLTVTGNTFEPNNNTEPIDPDYVKITGYDESKVDTLIASLVNSNTWPDGVDYSKAILVNTTEGPSIEEPDEGENSEPVNGDSGTPE